MRDIEAIKNQVEALKKEVAEHQAARGEIEKKLYGYWLGECTSREVVRRTAVIRATEREGLGAVTRKSMSEIEVARFLANNLVLPILLNRRQDLEGLSDTALSRELGTVMGKKAARLVDLGREAIIKYILDEEET